MPETQETGNSARERQKRSVWLLAAGAAALLLPLLGLLYFLGGDSGGSAPVNRDEVFQRRDAGQRKITPTQAAIPAPAAAPRGKAESSLDFVEAGADLKSRVAPAPKPAAAATPKASTSNAAPAAKRRTKKTRRHAAAPKLKPSAGFGNASRRPVGGSIFQDLPPEAQNDPAVQKYLQQPGL